MNSVWSQEGVKLLILAVSCILFGLVSDLWLISILLHCGAYIFWLLWQLSEFEQWIKRGANKKEAPNSSGVWQSMVQHLYRSQKSQKDRKEQLAKLANYYHAVMRALPDATIAINQNMEIEWANNASQKLLGVKPNKDVGNRIDNILRGPEIDKLFDTETTTDRVIIESPVSKIITLSVTRQEYDRGNSLIIAQDISQRIATQKLRKAFIANASHELRTPLTVISGYLEILLDDDDLAPEISNVLSNAFEQSARMDQILNNLLVLSKLEEKSYSKDSGDEVDVAKLLDRIVSDFSVSYSNSNHKFSIKADAYDLLVVEEEFLSLCENLISNAIKYSPEGSTITIGWSKNSSGLGCLSVEDQGEGIAEQHLARVTQRFYRVQGRSRTIAGTGLGLSIVKHIVDNFGGYLDIKSTLNKGSTFTACFPEYRLIKKKNQNN